MISCNQEAAAHCSLLQDRFAGRGNPGEEKEKRIKEEREGGRERGEEAEKRGWRGEEEGRKKEERRGGGRVRKERGEWGGRRGTC